MKNLLLTFLALCFTAIAAQAQSNGSVWKKTIIVTTLDGASMEYLIDDATKIKVEKPNLVIETEGVTLSYELEKMGQMRYGKRLVDDGIHENVGGSPFTFDNETFFFEHLPENSLIEIFSTDGKMVVSRKCNGSTQISIQSLTSGTYVVKANNDTYKILKK